MAERTTCCTWSSLVPVRPWISWSICFSSCHSAVRLRHDSDIQRSVCRSAPRCRPCLRGISLPWRRARRLSLQGVSRLCPGACRANLLRDGLLLWPLLCALCALRLTLRAQQCEGRSWLRCLLDTLRFTLRLHVLALSNHCTVSTHCAPTCTRRSLKQSTAQPSAPASLQQPMAHQPTPVRCGNTNGITERNGGRKGDTPTAIGARSGELSRA